MTNVQTKQGTRSPFYHQIFVQAGPPVLSVLSVGKTGMPGNISSALKYFQKLISRQINASSIAFANKTAASNDGTPDRKLQRRFRSSHTSLYMRDEGMSYESRVMSFKS